MNSNSATDYIVYHATTKENAESILRSNQFRLPTQQHAIEKGLKLGAGVYFGTDPGYSMDEALNSLLDAEPKLTSTYNLRKNNNKSDRTKLQNERLVCLEVSVDLKNGPNSEFSFGNYHEGQTGKKVWPLFRHHSPSATSPIEPLLLPNGKSPITDKPLSSREWDESTERLTPDYLQTFYGIDVLTINEDTDRQFELVLYELDCIVNIQEWNINSTTELN